MTRYLNWYGRIALINVPTTEGSAERPVSRTLTELTGERLPVPVLYRPQPRPGFRPHTEARHVGTVTWLRTSPALPGVWANLRVDLDALPQVLDRSLYPEVDVDTSGIEVGAGLRFGGVLLAVTLGHSPAWPGLAPVIEVESDE